jgi:protein-glutamine gamma-glutamyltransferase
MNLPPFLLGLAVLLWGWHSSIWILLLFAIPLAVILEARHFVRWRWQVSDDHLRRMVNFCWRMTAVGLLYLLVMQRSFGLIYVFLQYLPAAFASLVILQAYGILETIQVRDLLPRVPLFRSKRSESRQSLTFALSNPDPWARTLPFTHVQVGYVLLCLVAASAAGRQDPNFYFCMAGLSLWMLWVKRSRRVKPVVWLGLIVLTVGLGFGGHVGLHQLQGKVDQQASQWLHQSGQEADPFQARTRLGSLGELKQSNQIFFRVNAANPKLFPLLLRDASYNLYRSSTWIAQQPQFRSVAMQQDGRTWQLGNSTQPSHLPAVTITTDLRNGRGLLSLPDGSQQLQQLPVEQVERNQYGAVKVAGPAGTVAYQVTFDPQNTWDSPPIPADLEIPEPEQPAIAQVVQQLQLEGKLPQEVMERLSAFFQNQFQYSLKLSSPARAITPLTAFLLQNRSGHCEYFASATVLLLRQVGIPARYATGYSVHEFSNLEGQYVVRGRNAHAWTMVYVQDHWQALDTTPAAWMGMEDRAAPFWQRCLDVWSWVILKLATGFSDLAKSYLVLLALGTLLLGIMLLGLKSLWRRKHLLPKAKPSRSVPKLAQSGHDSEFYRIEQALAQCGCQRQIDEPLQSWLQRLETQLPARQFADLQVILNLHYRYRFDPEGLTTSERDQLKTLSRDWLQEQAISPKVG